MSVSSREKGDRRERQARELYEAAGYAVQPFYGRPYGETDGYNLFDLMAVKAREPVRFIQVKSNSASGVTDWAEECRNLMPTHFTVCDFQVCHDGDGWRLLRPVGDSYQMIFDGRKEELDMGEAMAQYLRNE